METFLFFKLELQPDLTIPQLIFYHLMYTPLDTVYIYLKHFFVYVKTRIIRGRRVRWDTVY
jgi:hypothetical protein